MNLIGIAVTVFLIVSRAPFDEIVRAMASHSHVLAVDIPSGWDVEQGLILNQIDSLVSSILI